MKRTFLFTLAVAGVLVLSAGDAAAQDRRDAKPVTSPASKTVKKNQTTPAQSDAKPAEVKQEAPTRQAAKANDAPAPAQQAQPATPAPAQNAQPAPARQRKAVAKPAARPAAAPQRAKSAD